MWFLGSSPHIQLNTLQSLILLHLCSSSGTYEQPLLSEIGTGHEQQYKIPMLEPSSEDISHLLMVLFPHISLSGLKSPPGWALLISKASRRCSRSPQAQAGSREGNYRAL